MDLERLAQVIRRYDSIDLLATEIETLAEIDDVETIDELSGFLEDELDLSGQ